uniref:N_BRCA1_IG domain-containing protein n=1 Tax=Anopheles atroparvus TaxID=41427 RepID=A0A182IKB7_ANOAO
LQWSIVRRSIRDFTPYIAVLYTIYISNLVSRTVHWKGVNYSQLEEINAKNNISATHLAALGITALDFFNQVPANLHNHIIMENSDQQSTSTPLTDDIEQTFLTQFSSMVTTDKEELIKQFQSIGENLNSTTATFFLDMSNWNLQAAVGCYFDFMIQSRHPSMRLLEDITVGRGEKITPNTAIKLTWVLQNNGDVAWPSGTYLGLKQTPQELQKHPTLSYEDLKFYVPAILPNESEPVSVQLVSPPEEGMFETVWSTYTPNGISFGEEIISRIEVSKGGTMAVTQQFSQLETDSSSAANLAPSGSQSNDLMDTEMWG